MTIPQRPAPGSMRTDPGLRPPVPARRRTWQRLVALAFALGAALACVPPATAADSADKIGSSLQRLESDAAAAGHVSGVINDSLGTVQASIGRCLAELGRGGVNNEVATVLRNIARKPGQAYFNLSTEGVLAKLQRAAGRKLNLSAFDLQVCVATYSLYFDLTAHTDKVLTNPAIGCQPNQNFCQGTEPGAYICCGGNTPICAQSCDEDGDCEPYCEPSLSCFPGDATVQAEDGSLRRMDELRIGDRVEVVRADGSLGFEDVYLFTHKDGAVTAPYVTLTLGSGRALTLSPRHFIPTATAAGGWQDRVLKAAEEVQVGDTVWYQGDDGAMASAPVTAAATGMRAGLFNPLTLGGTIVVDGVAASAHSDWFLDGIASPDTQAAVYQAMFAPVRLIYAAIGPAWTETVAEGWGVVDLVRDGTGPATRERLLGLLLGLALLMGGAWAWRASRAPAR
ncbi:MAG: hypothetical protein U1E17_15160 [Geminicoccaceae bacterium]